MSTVAHVEPLRVISCRASEARDWVPRSWYGSFLSPASQTVCSAAGQPGASGSPPPAATLCRWSSRQRNSLLAVPRFAFGGEPRRTRTGQPVWRPTSFRLLRLTPSNTFDTLPSEAPTFAFGGSLAPRDPFPHTSGLRAVTTQRGIMATLFPALLRSRGRPSPLHRTRGKGSALPTDPTERGGPPPLLGLSPGLCGPRGTVAYFAHRTVSS